MGPLDHSAPLCPRVQKSHPARFLAGTSGDDGGAEQDGLKAAARGFCCSRSAPASPRPLQLCPRSLATQPPVLGWGAECGGGGGPRPLQLCPCSLATRPPVPGWGAECGGGGGWELPALPLLRLLFQRTAHPLGAQGAGGPPQGGVPQAGLPQGGLPQGGLSQRRPAGLPLLGRLPSDRSLQRRLGGSAPWCRGEVQTCSYKQHHSFHPPSLSSECTGTHACGRACVYTPTCSRVHTLNPVCDLLPICPCPALGAPPLPRLSSLPPPPALWGQQVPARPFWPEAAVMSILRDLKLPKAAGGAANVWLCLFLGWQPTTRATGSSKYRGRGAEARASASVRLLNYRRRSSLMKLQLDTSPSDREQSTFCYLCH